MVRWLTRKYDIPTVFCMMAVVAIGLCLPLTTTLAQEPRISPHHASPLSKTILLAGNGPERYLMEMLANAFEQLHPSISVDFFGIPMRSLSGPLSYMRPT